MLCFFLEYIYLKNFGLKYPGSPLEIKKEEANQMQDHVLQQKDVVCSCQKDYILDEFRSFFFEKNDDNRILTLSKTGPGQEIEGKQGSSQDKHLASRTRFMPDF